MGKAMTLAAPGHHLTLHCALGCDGATARIRAACEVRGIATIVDEHDAPRRGI